jgi:Popeye protein conserved region
MTAFSPDYFIHAANVLLLVAYSVRDILWLRLFAVGASVISIPYFLLQPTTLRAPLVWTVVFAGINLLQSWRLFIERRPVQLSPEEEEVRRLVFSDLPHRKVLQVLNIGSWTTAAAGERLIVRGTLPDAVLLILRGTVQVARNGQIIGDLHSGEFVGSSLILSGVTPDVDQELRSLERTARWT